MGKKKEKLVVDYLRRGENPWPSQIASARLPMCDGIIFTHRDSEQTYIVIYTEDGSPNIKIETYHLKGNEKIFSKELNEETSEMVCYNDFDKITKEEFDGLLKELNFFTQMTAKEMSDEFEKTVVEDMEPEYENKRVEPTLEEVADENVPDLSKLRLKREGLNILGAIVKKVTEKTATSAEFGSRIFDSIGNLVNHAGDAIDKDPESFTQLATGNVVKGTKIVSGLMFAAGAVLKGIGKYADEKTKKATEEIDKTLKR